MTAWNDTDDDINLDGSPAPEPDASDPASGAAAAARPYDMADPAADDTAWSPAQVTRLEGEWRRLQRAFAYHPHITMAPIRGDPPNEYQVDYRVTTLVVDDAGQLQYADAASVHIWLPPGFPAQPPVVRPMSGVFHPNVTWEGIYLPSPWHPSETLVRLIVQVGELFALRLWDPGGVVNPPALDWVNANAHTLPLDSTADFEPTAGGEPLGRICRFGHATIDSIRRSLVSLRTALLGPEPPEIVSVREFAQRTCTAATLFLASDLPDELRAQGAELDRFARELLTDVPIYDYLETSRAATTALWAAVHAAQEAQAPLAKELERLATIVDAGEPSEPMIVLRLIPDRTVLQTFQLSLPQLIAEAERRLGAIDEHLASIDALPEAPSVRTDARLDLALSKERAAAVRELGESRRGAQAVLASVQQAIASARAEQMALERITRWREYADLMTKARALERRVAEWDSGGVQACYIENESGRFGPFPLEQPLDIGDGGGEVILRNLVRGVIEVRRADTDQLVAEGKDGSVSVNIAAATDGGNADDTRPPTDEWGNLIGPPPEPQVFATTFRLTERCDDLLVQFDFLRRQTTEHLMQKEPEAGYAASSWCGHFCRLLAKPATRQVLKRELSKLLGRWKAVMLDLAALTPYKERLTTYFLLVRASRVVPPLVQALRAARAGLKESDQRLGQIVRHCGRDVNTDQLIIPAKYSAAYNAEMALRHQAGETIRRSLAVLKPLTVQLTARLNDAKLLGRAEAPTLAGLSPLPESIVSLAMDDYEVAHLVLRLEELLQMPLGGPRPALSPQPEEAATDAFVTAEAASASFVDGAVRVSEAVSGDTVARDAGEVSEMIDPAVSATESVADPADAPLGETPESASEPVHRSEPAEAQAEEIADAARPKPGQADAGAAVDHRAAVSSAMKDVGPGTVAGLADAHGPAQTASLEGRPGAASSGEEGVFVYGWEGDSAPTSASHDEDLVDFHYDAPPAAASPAPPDRERNT